MDNRTFKQRCFYVGVTVVILFVVMEAMVNIKSILLVAGGIGQKFFKYISPLIYGFIIAYLVHIPANKMEESFRKHKKVEVKKPRVLRIVSVVVTYLAVVILIVAVLVSIYLMIGGQLSANTGLQEISEYIIEYVTSFEFEDSSIISDPAVKDMLDSVKEWVQTHFFSSVSNFSTTVMDIGGTVITAGISFIISIYFAMDYERLVKRMGEIYVSIFGRFSLGRKLYRIIVVFDKIFRQFLKGQLTEACFVAILSVVALKIAGVQYFGVIGIMAGICNMIPFVGPWIGAAVAVAVSLLGGNYMSAVWACVAMIVVQQIDNHLLAPKVVGESVGLHPVITMIMLIVGSDIGGIIGMLLAVPVAATVKALLDERKTGRASAQNSVRIDPEDFDWEDTPSEKEEEILSVETEIIENYREK